jgi:predicted small lipoprotein YifL
MRKSGVLIFLILLLAGCGQYGPLQLPEKPVPPASTQKV